MTPTSAEKGRSVSAHPLDPLTEAEIVDVQRILVREKDIVRPHWRIASIELR